MIRYHPIGSIGSHNYIYPRWNPHPAIVTFRDTKDSIRVLLHSYYTTIRDNEDFIRVLLHSYYTTITGWGVLLTYAASFSYYYGGWIPNIF